MTEDEAENNWCPMARVRRSGTDEAAANRVQWNPEEWEVMTAARCIGSCCMAWRWTNEVTRRGYCGLAGVPVG